MLSREQGPSLLGLARLGPRGVLPPGGEELYRHVARLVELGPEREFLVVPCGHAVTTEFLARTTGATGAGVDPDAELVERAVERAKEAGLARALRGRAAGGPAVPGRGVRRGDRRDRPGGGGGRAGCGA